MENSPHPQDKILTFEATLGAFCFVGQSLILLAFPHLKDQPSSSLHLAL